MVSCHAVLLSGFMSSYVSAFIAILWPGKSGLVNIAASSVNMGITGYYLTHYAHFVPNIIFIVLLIWHQGFHNSMPGNLEAK